MKLDDVSKIIKNECIIENQLIENEQINMSNCSDLKILNCKFNNVRFICNQYETLEISNCEFNQCLIEESWEDILLNCNRCTFCESVFQNFSFVGPYEPSQIMDSQFYDCKFENVRILADLSICGVSLDKCNFENIEAKMNLCFENQITDTIFRNGKLDLPIKKNVFNNLTLEKVSFEGIDEENVYNDCKKE